MKEDTLEFVPSAISYVHMREKQQFQLPSDTYENWILFAVTAGSFWYELSGEAGIASFGDIVFCPPGILFKREVVNPTSFHFYTFKWSKTNDKCTSNEPYPIGAIRIKDRDRLLSTYTYLKQVDTLRGKQRLLSIDTLFCDLWHQYWLEEWLAEQTPILKAPSESMRHAMQWIQEHSFEAVSLKSYALASGLTPVQLTRQFQAAFGQSPIEYITALRLERAKQLLLETKLNLDDIAEQCGYENGFYLSRMFTKKMKISPSQFQKKYRV
ncbi:AraC family transcriptional regulator [Paenibacillus sp. FSL H7-0714]|uniref:AraC family transcriptional regulator n=1 Tax=Paenibacillus sp. FSL H7-0714 TaxID=2954735 RepID=UPI0030FBD810